MGAYLAIDLGTTGCRSSIFDENLNVIAYAYEEYPLITPCENQVEQDANLWWELTLKTVSESIDKSEISGKEIRSISVSSQGITLVPVDEVGKPLMNAISWLDSRAVEETEQIRKDFGDEKIFSMTGKPINEAYTLPKLLWIKKHYPEVYQKAEKFLMPMDFLIGKITGKFVTDYSMASGTLMYDLKNHCWSEEILAKYDIPVQKLPELMESGTVVGKVSPGLAVVLGLSLDCTVIQGAQDQKCAAFGVGLSPEKMTVSLGTAAAVTGYRESAENLTNQGIGWCGYTKKDIFVMEGVINTAGTCLRWVRDTIFPGKGYDIINRAAKEAEEKGGRVLFYPYLAGASAPDFYPESEGVFYGLSLDNKPGDLALAVMKGVAFQLRTLLEAMDAYAKVTSLIIFGGGAESELWCRIIADSTGMKVCIPETTEAACYGAARLAAIGVGADVPPLKTKKELEPGEKSTWYQEEYKRFKQIEEKLWRENNR